MSNWPGWTPDEEIVLVWFLSCGIKKSAVSKLIAYKCGTAQRDEQDMKLHVFQLHITSSTDRRNGVGPLLVPNRQAPTSRGEVPEVWAVDWKDCWKENNVDDWLLRKTSWNYRLGALTSIGKCTEDLICQGQSPDEIDWDWVEHRQRELVRRHSTAYGGNYNN